MIALTVQLTDEQIEILAEQVADLLDRRRAGAPLVDATRVAEALGVSRDYVYEHAGELGGRKVGAGDRPRWRFDLDQARAARPVPASPRRTRRRREHAAGLLPIHEDTP